MSAAVKREDVAGSQTSLIFDPDSQDSRLFPKVFFIAIGRVTPSSRVPFVIIAYTRSLSVAVLFFGVGDV